MNRNDLFRKSLLSTAVVAVLHTYSMGAAAACIPENVDGVNTIIVDDGTDCGDISITTPDNVNHIEVEGIVTGDITNATDLSFLKIEAGDVGEGWIQGSVINQGDISHHDVHKASFSLSGPKELLTVDGDVLNAGSATYMQVEHADIGGDIINSGQLTDDFLLVDDTIVYGSVINTESGTIGSAENSVYDAILLNDAVIKEGVINNGTITGENSGILISKSEITGTQEIEGVLGAVVNNGDINLGTGGKEYAGRGMFGIQITNAMPLDAPGGSEDQEIATSIISGSVINTGNITVTDGAPEEPQLQDDRFGGIYIGSEWRGKEDDSVAAHVKGNVINTGTIDVSVTNTDRGETFGILIENAIVDGTVGNIGIDSLITTSREGIIVVDGSDVGDIVNEGTITVTEFWDGIYVDSSSAASISNSGSITTTAGSGIYLDAAVVEGTIRNDGQITANGAYIEYPVGDYEPASEYLDGSGIFVSAYGECDEEYDDCPITPSYVGSIINGENGVINATEAGIDIDHSVIGSISNLGKIVADRVGIYAENGTIEGNITNSGLIEADGDGISLMGVEATGIVNLGSITAHNGLGIYSSGSNLTDGIYNDGQITSDGPGIIAVSYSPEETVQVGFIANDENGVITADYGPGIGAFAVIGESLANTGTINAESGIVAMLSTLTDGVVNTGTINADWVGIQLDTTQAGTVANQGTINVSADYGAAIDIRGSKLTTGVYNNGTLNASEGILASGYPDFGPVRAAEDLPPPPPPPGPVPLEETAPLSIGSVVNDEDGVINATAEDSYGIGLEFVEVVGLGNAGIINASYGLNVYESILTDDIVNTGTISASDTGIAVENSQVNGNILNEGSINGDYQGIHINGKLSGDILNTGTISSDQGAAIYTSFGVDHDGSVENYGSISGGNDGETVTAIDYRNAFAPLTLVQKAGQIIGNIWGSSEDSGDSAYIDGGNITGDLHDIEGIYVDGVTTLDGNIYGADFINIESSGNLTVSGEARSFEGYLNLYGGALSLNISNDTKPEEAMLSTEGEIYLSSDSRLIITASQNLEVNLDPVDYLALSGSALYNNGVTVESGSAIITAELAEVTEDSLSVTVATNDFGQVIESVGATGNEVEVIDAYMQEYIASSGGECNAICQAIEQAETAEELAAIAEEMVPDSSGVVGASQAAQSETLGAVFKRIAGFRSSVSGVSSGDNIEPGSLWMQALASDGDQDAVQYQGNDFDGYSYRTRGFTIGADADLSDTLTAGLAVTYGVTKSDVEGSANRSETDSYLLTAYGSWRQQDYFMDSSIAFGVSRSDIEQYTANVKSTADSDAAQVALRLVTGRTFAFNDNDTIVEPQVAFNYSRVDTNNYTLQPLNMEVLDQRIETVELGAGLRAMTAIDTKRGLLIPEVNLMAWHDFAADRGDTAARFLTGAGNSFVTTGAKPEQTNYQAGLGVQYWLNNNVSLSANYDRNWNSNFSADTWLANIRYDF